MIGSALSRLGLGGCLALDMGLGKTPTMLAHLARTSAGGPALVIAPPAVVVATMGDLLDACVQVTGSDAQLRASSRRW